MSNPYVTVYGPWPLTWPEYIKVWLKSHLRPCFPARKVYA